MKISEADREARLQRQLVIHVRDTMRSVLRTRLDTPPTNPSQTSARILIHRELGWLQSFVALAGPAHFQALQSGARSLLESVVDLTLITTDPTHELAAQMEAWETSAKFKHAQCAAKYASANATSQPGMMSPARLAELTAFVNDPARRAAVDATRAKYWKGDHPPTWTGKNLGMNCASADKVYPPSLKAFRGDITFESRYEIEYRQLCWSTHGSAGTSVRGLDAEAFHVFAGQAYHHAVTAGLASIALGLRAWGLDPFTEFDVDILMRRLDRARTSS